MDEAGHARRSGCSCLMIMRSSGVGVRDLLEAEPDITVIGEAGTAASALARIPALKPDVAVLDIRLPDGDGVTVCRDIRSKMPQLACLMLTSFSDDEALFDAIMAGAAGYVLKQIRGTDLVGAVRTIASGQSLLDPEAASRVMRRMRDQATATDPLAGLTDQERRILALIGEGLTNRQIGDRLFLAEKTVKNYVSALFAKLGMQRRAQAAAYATRIFDQQHRRRRLPHEYREPADRSADRHPPVELGAAALGRADHQLAAQVGGALGHVRQAAAPGGLAHPGAVVTDPQDQLRPRPPRSRPPGWRPRAGPRSTVPRGAR